MRPPITWPRGVRSAACLTFDLDAETAWISRDPANLGRLSVMSQGAYGPKVGVPLILDFLDRNQLTTTFFVPGWTAERWADVVAEIHRRGHEIGHHGYLHEGLESAAWFADGRDTENAYYIPGFWWARTVAHWAKVKKD
jgi:peptidoglycan-N-acetylglucosamine deacetylase